MKKLNRFRMKLFLKLHNYLYRKISKLSKEINNNIHPKHRIINYHKFFLDNIEKDSKILDLGCGKGELAYDLANKAKVVVACDINKNYLDIAKKRYKRDNITYLLADATNYNFKETFDYIILSCVLEYIKDRVKFLSRIKPLANILLIRAATINRSWLTLYKKELGLENKDDLARSIGYTFETFQNEIENVGLRIISYSIQFGEIWAKIEL